MIARVVFNVPVDRGFDYLIPPELLPAVRPGVRVVAPFGRRRLVGTVLEVRTESPIAQLKGLLRVIDPRPLFSRGAFRLARWMSGYYGCSLGQACATMAPASLRLRPEPADDEKPREDPPNPSGPALTREQAAAFDAVAGALRSGGAQGFLLYGVTGSGKTELYLRAIAQVLGQGGCAIVLVPEIALTPQMIDRFRGRFGELVGLWHSRLTARQRGRQWSALAQGRCRVVVGTRSAVFAPLADVRLIVLDEEHEPSYKQDQTPRYHAREVAMARARLSRAVVVLGSATPSVESFYAAERGRLRLLRMSQRVQGRLLPKVEIVDMREEMARGTRRGPFSSRLSLALRQVVDLQEQAILLLNRRGFARAGQCHACGAVIRCAECVVPMIYHARSDSDSRPRDAAGGEGRPEEARGSSQPGAARPGGQLICHYCNAARAIPETCPECRKGYIRLRGMGTERIESELYRLFPSSGIGRMDTDTTRRRESHRELYEQIKTQHIDLLVGTQMVAKGLDIPQVTLVGVVSADTALNLPDFRAGERTFDLLTQVAGRAGRGERPGRVIIQTYCPTNYAIQAASRHDYEAFYRQELETRRQLSLPPFSHLVELTVHGRGRERVEAAARRLAQRLSAASGSGIATLLGPAPHRIVRLRGQFRWHLMLNGRSVRRMVRAVRAALSGSHTFDALPVAIDVDPL